MKKYILLIALTLTSVSTVVSALPGGSYFQTCHRCSLNYRGALVCRCLDRNQFPVWSKLPNARNCARVKNIDGNLTCMSWYRPRPRPGLRPLPRGSYLQTCRGCTHVGNVLSCVCATANGLSRSTYLRNPGQCRGIQNINGRLVCR